MVDPIRPLFRVANSPIEIEGSSDGVLDLRVKSLSEAERVETSWGRPKPTGWKSNDFEPMTIGV